MTAATLPTTIIVAPTTVAECFDCGVIAPVEPWTDDAGAVSLLCIDREPCRRRQLGNCDECWTLGRRCWSCRHPQLVAMNADTA